MRRRVHLRYFLFICKFQNSPDSSLFLRTKKQNKKHCFPIDGNAVSLQIRNRGEKHQAFHLPGKRKKQNRTSDEKVFQRRTLPCPQLNRRWKISLMQQRGALCHFDSIWRDCIKGVAPEVRPHSLARYYFRLSVSQ